MSYIDQTRPEYQIDSFNTTGRQTKIDFFRVDGICLHCNTVFEIMACFYHFCPCQEVPQYLTQEDIQRASKKKNSMNWVEVMYKWKVSSSLKCGIVSGADCTREPLMLIYLSEKLPLKTSTYRKPTSRRNKGDFLVTFNATLKYLKFWD